MPDRGLEELERTLAGVALLGGEGNVDLDDPDPLFVVIVHDGSGFNPGAAIATDQNRYHASIDPVLQVAFEILEDIARDL